MSKLPQVTISDSIEDDSCWDQAQGWSGLVPGVTTFDQAVLKLGQPSDSYDRLNSRSFEFFGGTLVLTTFNDAPDIIAKVRVLPVCANQNLNGVGPLEPVPVNLSQAKAWFGKLVLVKHDTMQGLIFERPGVRIACDTNPEPEPIRWIEFH